METLTLEAIKNYAKRLGLVGYSTFRKTDLVQAMIDIGVPDRQPTPTDLAETRFIGLRLGGEKSPASSSKTSSPASSIDQNLLNRQSVYISDIIENNAIYNFPQNVISLLNRIMGLGVQDAVKILKGKPENELSRDYFDLEYHAITIARNPAFYPLPMYHFRTEWIRQIGGKRRFVALYIRNLYGCTEEETYELIDKLMPKKPSEIKEEKKISAEISDDLGKMLVRDLKILALKRGFSIKGLTRKTQFLALLEGKSPTVETKVSRPIPAISYATIHSGECQICYSDFGPVNVPLLCQKCKFIACSDCISRHLDGIPIPACMDCREMWTYQNMIQMGLTPEFIGYIKLTQYAPMLLNQLRGEAENILERIKIQERFNEMEKEIREIKGQCSDAFKSDRTEHKRLLAIRKQKEEELRNLKIQTALGQSKGDETIKEKIRCPLDQAPGEGCTGTVRSDLEAHNGRNYCDTCDRWICIKCMKEREKEHECDPNDVETVKALRHNTRSCPRCRASIFKTEGCDQMFCTLCHTAFSWSSGKIETGRIHNPYFFQLSEEVRARLQGDMNVRVNTEGDACNVMPDFSQLKRTMVHLLDPTNQEHRILYKTVTEQYRLALELIDTRIRLHVNPETERKTMYEWATKTRTDDEMKSILLKRDKRTEKESSRRDLVEFFRLASTAIFDNLVSASNIKQFHRALADYYELKKEYNRQCDILGSIYNSINFNHI